MTLTRALFPSMSWLGQVGLVVFGSIFIAIAAQISVPMYPVPMTLQTLAILMVGFAFGSRLGAATLLAYLAEGAVGLPVFASGNAGLPYMMGPTGGFLLGFVAMAWIAGFAAERGLAKYFFGTLVVALFASAFIYLPGIAWPMSIAGATGAEGSWVGQAFDSYYWTYFIAPFLIGDTVKAALAALLVTTGWTIFGKR